MADFDTTPMFPVTTKWINDNLADIAPYRDPATIVKIVDDGPAAGWFYQLSADIGISHAKAIGEEITDEDLVAKIEKDRGKGRGNEIIGLLIHETAHSAWSKWLTDYRTKKPADAEANERWLAEILTWVEEIRIETRAMNKMHGRVRNDLRAMFRALVLSTMGEIAISSKFGASMLWCLAVGRKFSTVCEADEVRSIDDVCRTVLGDDVVDELHEILDQLVVLDITTPGGLRRGRALAKEWLDLVGEPEPAFISMTAGERGDEGEGDEGEDGGGSGEGEDDSDDGSGGSGGKSEEDDDAAAGSGSDGKSKTTSDESDRPDHEARETGMGDYGATETTVTDSGSTNAWQPIDGDAAEAMLDEVTRMRNGMKINKAKPGGVKMADEQEMARKVFGDKVRDPRVYVERAPSPEERRAVGQLAQRLEAMNYTAPHISHVPSLVPPGRLNTRAAVHSAAERSRGQMITAKPWQAKKRRHVHNPPITLALMTDVSGSMHWAENLVASTAYIFSNALNRVSGRFAAVTFGNHAECVVRPNERITRVYTRPANGGTEMFDQGLAALNGTMHLTSAKGVRVLVVVSDGHFVETGEPTRLANWAKRLHESGVGLVWLDNSSSHSTLPDTAHTVQITSADVTKFINPIATAIESAIQSSLAAA